MGSATEELGEIAGELPGVEAEDVGDELMGIDVAELTPPSVFLSSTLEDLGGAAPFCCQ
jgi:hypothetical protein